MVSKNIVLKWLMVFFFIAISNIISAQNKIDSLKHLLNIVKSDSEKIVLMNQLSEAIIKDGNINNRPELIVLNTNAVSLAKNISFDRGLAESLFNKGRIELFSKDPILSNATYSFYEAKKYFERFNDSLGIAKCYMQLGLINYIIKYYEKSVKYLSESLSFNNTLDLQNGIAKYLMAISYSENSITKDTSLAIKYFKQALSVYKKFGEEKRELECYTYMAKMFLKENDTTNSDNIFNKIYSEDFNKVLIENNGRLMAVQSLSFFKKNDFNKSIQVGLSAYKIGINSNDFITRTEAANVLYQAYSKTQDFKNAYYFLYDYNLMSDSVYKSNITQQIAEMMVKSEFEKKDIEEGKKYELSKREVENQKNIRNSILGILIVAIGFLIVVFIQRTRLAKEKNRGEELLLNILPASVAKELKISDRVHAENYDLVSVMFTDFKDFTKMTSTFSAIDLVTEIDYCFSAFDKIVSKYNIEKIKTIGDAYMCASGVPKPNPSHAVDIIYAAFEIQKFMTETATKRKIENKPFFEIRCGIHSGPVVAGVVGTTKFAYDIWGATVNIASRIESAGETGKINVSGTTYELIKHKFNCSYRGKVQAKNIGEIDMYFVEDTKV